MFTRRSAIVQYQRCPRSRYWQYEFSGGGLEPIRQSIPLVTGTGVHLGLASLLNGEAPQKAISASLGWYDASCERRGLKLDDLEDYSFVYRQQRALIEAQIWLGHYRIIPKLREVYDILEVERQGQIPDFGAGVALNYRPDALLRSREDGDLYILSWKTAAQVGKWTEDDARVDMQGISEMWARKNDATPPPGEIRGVQMVFLLKGRKVPMSGQDNDVDSKQKRLDSPLIWGYQDKSFPPKLAAARYYHCTGPHPMRKSKWYPTGQCEQLGKLHRRGDDWESFPTWEAMGVAEWMRLLDAGEVAADEGDVLARQWTMPVPFYRTPRQTESWLRQTRTQEERIAAVTAPDLVLSPEIRQVVMDDVFPQYTHNCNHLFGGTCPCYELCWGPPQVAESPLDSGIYQPHEQYATEEIQEVE